MRIDDRWTKITIMMMTVAGLLMAGICMPQSALANNIQVTSVSFGTIDRQAGTAEVQFNISWLHAWTAPTFWDAAWIFIKYSTDSGATWHHATLTANRYLGSPVTCDGAAVSSNLTVSADLKGAWYNLGQSVSGALSATGAKLTWDFKADNVPASATAIVKVFAIEMVYIPAGSYYLGLNGWGDGFYTTPLPNYYVVPLYAVSLTVGPVTGQLYYGNTSTSSGDQVGPIPADFPKGNNGFWLMKYEISQGQYADFLNTLTPAQAVARYPAYYNNYRYRIATSGGPTPTYSTDRPDRACNYLNWADLAAYLDWAALRPMTELEYEKACRGTIAPIANEYAWGSTVINQAQEFNNNVAGPEDGTERITSVVGANCNYGPFGFPFNAGDAGNGPLRCGIFATSSTITRVASGAGYYGNMELSGNVWERTVTVGNPTGRAFDGSKNGDGELTRGGNANVLTWPGTDAVGAGFRGGSWSNAIALLCTGDRTYAALTDTTRQSWYGGRGARTA